MTHKIEGVGIHREVKRGGHYLQSAISWANQSTSRKDNATYSED